MRACWPIDTRGWLPLLDMCKTATNNMAALFSTRKSMFSGQWSECRPHTLIGLIKAGTNNVRMATRCYFHDVVCNKSERHMCEFLIELLASSLMSQLTLDNQTWQWNIAQVLRVHRIAVRQFAHSLPVSNVLTTCKNISGPLPRIILGGKARYLAKNRLSALINQTVSLVVKCHSMFCSGNASDLLLLQRFILLENA